MFDNLFWSISWEQAVCARGKTTQWRPARRCTPVSTCAQKIYFFYICKGKHQWGFEWTKLMHILLHLDQPIRKAFHPCRQNFTIPHQPHILHVKHIHVKHILIEHCTDARTTENWRKKTHICVFAFIYRWNGSFGGKAKRVEIQTESIELPRLSKCWSWLITMALYYAVHQNILHCCPFVQCLCVLLYSSMVYPNIPPLTSIHTLYNALPSVQQ